MKANKISEKDLFEKYSEDREAVIFLYTNNLIYADGVKGRRRVTKEYNETLGVNWNMLDYMENHFIMLEFDDLEKANDFITKIHNKLDYACLYSKGKFVNENT